MPEIDLVRNPASSTEEQGATTSRHEEAAGDTVQLTLACWHHRKSRAAELGQEFRSSRE
jgi:hypothetical protein